MDDSEENKLKEAVHELYDRTPCPFPVKCCGNDKMLLKTDDATGFQCVSSKDFHFGIMKLKATG